LSTTRCILLAAIAGLFAWFFADALFRSGMFVFRDAAHFYYPLFQFVSDEWAAGRVPLWNPYENLGQPLAGNPTASVFYPGKLIFALPLSYDWAYRVYVTGHVLLAAWGAYRLARRFEAGVYAAGVCAVSYAFSGNVLYQYCNVVFLVGAAWLPLAMLAADRMLIKRSPGWAVALGSVLALMVLGGDPQMAYHAGLLAAAWALWRWRCKKRGQVHFSRNEAKGKNGPVPFFSRCPALLAIAAAAGLILSAIQVLPSLEFTSQSGRFAAHSVDRLWGNGLEPGTHGEHIYHFSVGPWRLAEYLWPNVSGRQFPIHRRWLDAIPAEGRIWTPSLYMGLLPLLLALSAMRLRQKRGQDSFLAEKSPDPFFAWVVVIAVVASFGWYGLGWLVEEIRVAAGGDPAAPAAIGAPFGGVYWLMTLLLPGYGSFRYPAKLLVVAALGLSLLAARGWDRTFAVAEPPERFRRGLLRLGGLSLAAAIVALAIRPWWHGWFAAVDPNVKFGPLDTTGAANAQSKSLAAAVAPNVLFGPLDTTGAANDLLWAFAQTAVVCGAFWWLTQKRGQVHFSAENGPVPFFALILVAVDLAVANGWMVVSAPAHEWRQTPNVTEALHKPATVPMVYRHPIWMRPEWKKKGSPQRLAEAMRWDRDTLFPKYHLPSRVRLIEVHGTMMPYDYETFLQVGRKTVPVSIAQYVIFPGDKAVPKAKRIDVPEVADVSLWHNPRHLPRAWIVHRVDVLPPLASGDPAAVQRRTREVLYPSGRPRDLWNSAVVETDGRGLPGDFADVPSAAKRVARGEPSESCRVTHDDPLRVEIEAKLQRPGLVVLCDQYYPGWRLEVEAKTGTAARSQPILRTNRVMRGAWLPAGEYRLTYRYCPASFLSGAVLSGLGWTAVGLMIAWRLRKRRVAAAAKLACEGSPSATEAN